MVSGYRKEVESVILNARGKPLTAERCRELVDVSSPSEKLARINALFQQLDPTQSGAQGYSALKELRSQVGSFAGDALTPSGSKAG